MDSARKPAVSRKVPKWAKTSIWGFLTRHSEMYEALIIASRGIARMKSSPQVVEFLSRVPEQYVEGGKHVDDHSAKVAAREAALASREIERGFALLYSNGAVALWAALEDFIRTFAAALIQNRPEVRRFGPVAKLRLAVGDYEALDREERALYLAELLETELRAPLRSGVSRFEAMMESFGLGGSVEETVRRDLFELNQVRNVLVHRGGIADRKFLSACPWLDLKQGQEVLVSSVLYSKYWHAVGEYVVEIGVRFQISCGFTRDELQGSSKEAQPRSK